MRFAEMSFQAGARAAGLLCHDDSLGGWDVEVRDSDRTGAVWMPVIGRHLSIHDVQDAIQIPGGTRLKAATSSHNRKLHNGVVDEHPKLEFSNATMRQHTQYVGFLLASSKNRDRMFTDKRVSAAEHGTGGKTCQCLTKWINEGVGRPFSRPGGQREST